MLIEALKSRALRCVMGLFICVGLASCGGSRDAQYIACPDVRMLEDTESFSTINPETGNTLTIRARKLGAYCTQDSAQQDYSHDIEINLWLVVERQGQSLVTEEYVSVDTTLAFVDADNRVSGREVYSEQGRINAFSDEVDQLFVIKTRVPVGMRVVLGLGKAQ